LHYSNIGPQQSSLRHNPNASKPTFAAHEIIIVTLAVAGDLAGNMLVSVDAGCFLGAASRAATNHRRQY
jgi:hypothetical protein